MKYVNFVVKKNETLHGTLLPIRKSRMKHANYGKNGASLENLPVFLTYVLVPCSNRQQMMDLIYMKNIFINS
jgi:hypothetical protein